MTNKIVLRFGDPPKRVSLSKKDERLLREITTQRERWQRITPAGLNTYEPLLAEFERLNEKICVMKPGPYVGVVTLSDTTLEFNPPSWLKNLDNSNLFYMLSRSNPLLPKNVDLPESITKQKVSSDGFLEPLFNLFAIEINSALSKGVYKTYALEQTISSSLKGKIDFKRQFNLDISGSPRFAVQKQIFSEINDVNELLYKACAIVESSSQNTNTIALIEKAITSLPSFSKPKSIENVSNIKPERRGSYLNWALQLAKLIYNQESLSYQGNNADIFSIVINLFDLFETYVSSELVRRDSKFIPQFPLPLVNETELSNTRWDTRKIYPDLVYFSDKNLIIDTKLKKIGSGGPDISDVYQLFFYSSLLNVQRCIIVTPTQLSTSEIKKYPVSYNPLIKTEIICYGLPITGNENEMSTAIDDLYSFAMALV